MDIIFNCPKCEQELAVDKSGAGSEIHCPSCSEKIVIPQSAAPPSSGVVPVRPAGHSASAMSTSAAAKVEMHLKVPVHSQPAESLISKPAVPLEFAAKESDRKMKVKTIRHTDCIEVGHDKFDEMVTAFLQKVGETNIVSLTPLTYTHIDIGSQKLLADYAVLVVYRG